MYTSPLKAFTLPPFGSLDSFWNAAIRSDPDVSINVYRPLSRKRHCNPEEFGDSNGGNVKYVTMQITFNIPEFTRNERNLHCDVLHITTVRVARLVLDRCDSQPSRRRDKGL